MGDSYRPPPPRDWRRDADRGVQYSFRGAAHADRRDEYSSYRPADRDRPAPTSYRPADSYHAPRPPPDEFTFRHRHQAPHFPAEQPRPRVQPAQQRNNRNPHARPGGSRPSGFKNAHSRHGGRPQGYRKKPAAHERDILVTKRAPTPEQLEGMNADQEQRFVEYISSSDSEEEDEDDAASVGGQETVSTSRSRKRVKVNPAVDGDARPQWSNPDPYSVLPPTDMGIAPKKDIVETIRKAKRDALSHSAGVNAIKSNDDFISFDDHSPEIIDFDENDDEDKDDGDDMEDGEVGDGDFDHASPPPPSVPSRPPVSSVRLPSMPSSHPTRLPPPSAPSGFVMPSDQELMEAYVGETGNKKKRKHEDDLQTDDSIVSDWRPKFNSDPIPWYKNRSNASSTGLDLHLEIQDFYNYVQPARHEADVRDALIKRVEAAVRTFHNGRDVDVRCFGSYAAGLYLPTADMDLVAVSRQFLNKGRPTFCQSRTQMYNLSRHLAAEGIVKNASMQVVGKARVPILKWVDALTGVRVDMSFENDSGIRAIETFKRWMRDFPEMPILVVLLKQFLAMRNMNEVHTGGIGGMTTICLVVSMLQHLRLNQKPAADGPRYAELLLLFLETYGTNFDITATGIKLDPPTLFDKRDPTEFGGIKINPKRLTIINPNPPYQDISGGSNNITGVFTCFQRAHAAIAQRIRDVGSRKRMGSILQCILGGNYESFAKTREALRRASNQHRRSETPDSPYERSARHGYEREYSPAPSLPSRGLSVRNDRDDFDLLQRPQQDYQYAQSLRGHDQYGQSGYSQSEQSPMGYNQPPPSQSGHSQPGYDQQEYGRATYRSTSYGQRQGDPAQYGQPIQYSMPSSQYSSALPAVGGSNGGHALNQQADSSKKSKKKKNKTNAQTTSNTSQPGKLNQSQPAKTRKERLENRREKKAAKKAKKAVEKEKQATEQAHKEVTKAANREKQAAAQAAAKAKREQNAAANREKQAAAKGAAKANREAQAAVKQRTLRSHSKAKA